MKNQRYQFIKKKHAKGGRESVILAAVSLALFLICVIISYVMGGRAGIYVGGLSVIAMLLAAFGFVIGMRSFQEKGVSPLLSIIGSIGCGVVVVGWLTLYLAVIR